MNVEVSGWRASTQVCRKRKSRKAREWQWKWGQSWQHLVLSGELPPIQVLCWPDTPYFLISDWNCLCSGCWGLVHGQMRDWGLRFHQSGAFVRIDESSLIHPYYLQSTVYIRVQFWCCTSYGFGSIYNDKYPQLWYHTEYFHYSKNPLCCTCISLFMSAPGNHCSFHCVHSTFFRNVM